MERGNQLHTFWFKPVSYFGLFRLNEVYQRFTYVNHTIKACTLTTL